MNELGVLLKQLRGLNSLRKISEMTNGKISFTYLATVEKGVNPNNGQPVKPTPDTLKILSEVYNYSYEELLKLAGYLQDDSIDKVNSLFEEYKKLSSDDQQKFIELLNLK